MNKQGLILDIDQFDAQNMVYVKPLLFGEASKSLGIYYRKNDIKQKIVIQTPKMLAPFGVKVFDNDGKPSHVLSVSFNTLTQLYNEEEIKKFYRFVRKLDKTNYETIQDCLTRWKLSKNLKYNRMIKRVSNEYPYHLNLSLPKDNNNFLFSVFDEDAKRSTIDIIQKKSVVSVVMELTDVLFTDTSYIPRWTVMQIRKFNSYSDIHRYFMSNCFTFSDARTETESPVIPLPPPPEAPVFNVPIKKPAEKQKSIKFAPTLDQLAAGRKSLKKVNVSHN